jgi:hypothetical protein
MSGLPSGSSLSSPFLRLPPELRSRIYRELQNDHDEATYWTGPNNLRRVNRQLYEEVPAPPPGLMLRSHDDRLVQANRLVDAGHPASYAADKFGPFITGGIPTSIIMAPTLNMRQRERQYSEERGKYKNTQLGKEKNTVFGKNQKGLYQEEDSATLRSIQTGNSHLLDRKKLDRWENGGKKYYVKTKSDGFGSKKITFMDEYSEQKSKGFYKMPGIVGSSDQITWVPPRYSFSPDEQTKRTYPLRLKS